MPTYTPTWETIAGAFVTVLESSNAIDNASNGYPDDPISSSSLVYAIIREPDLTPARLTHGVVSLTWSGDVNVLVETINTDAPRLTTTLTNNCALKALEFQVDFANRNNSRLVIGGNATVTHVTTGQAQIGRFSPWSTTNAYSYAGFTVPYSITMHYESN